VDSITKWELPKMLAAAVGEVLGLGRNSKDDSFDGAIPPCNYSNTTM
jgi:hypothetical protein